jgi:phosphonate transport system ATP-binding protein
VGEARARGATVICSLHQIELARTVADRIVALRAGRVVFDGAPSEFSADRAQQVYGAEVLPLRAAQ